MKPLWLVERGENLRGLSLNKPTKGALKKHGLNDCVVRRSPVAPTQLALNGESDTFNEVVEPEAVKRESVDDSRQLKL